MSEHVRCATVGARLSALGLTPAALTAQASAQRPHVSVMLSGATDTRTASHKEPINGAFRTMAVQLSRPLFTVRGMHVAWLGEIMPAMLVTVGAPSNRLPTPANDPAEANDPRRLARSQVRDVFGVGFAPRGAEAAFSLGEKTQLPVQRHLRRGVVRARRAVR
ncbi:hypothetical protein [Gemmatimonas sp.]|uniref:hypothetical protein n=1 Tax=Gemmatimonas sp. TaxID=1962908 RepID=UPI003982EE43